MMTFFISIIRLRTFAISKPSNPNRSPLMWSAAHTKFLNFHNLNEAVYVEVVVYNLDYTGIYTIYKTIIKLIIYNTSYVHVVNSSI